MAESSRLHMVIDALFMTEAERYTQQKHYKSKLNAHNSHLLIASWEIEKN